VIAWDTQLIQISATKIKLIMQFCGWCEIHGIYQSEMLSGNVRAMILKQIEAENHQSLQFIRVLRKWSKQLSFQWVCSFFPKEYSTLLSKHQIDITTGYELQ
jgi:hypothetical protein